MPGTVTQVHEKLGHVRKVILTCTADSAAATYPTAVLPKFEGRLLALVTNPGAVGPTDNYDIVINDQHGHDVLEGVGGNRSITATQKVPVVYSGTGTHPAIAAGDALTLAITNNAVNSAVTVITLYYALGA